ncbi:MAG: DUF128 domain-containing protein [Deltaproteobacteria bacterium]|nr:DUF128 domain-containing protein [Deltaproteobacteria bacterium]
MNRKEQAILRILKETAKPLSGRKITTELQHTGHEISERTVRLYLHKMDESGLTLNFGKRGRQISALGLHELEATGIIEKVGFLSAKIHQMTYRMSFDLELERGTVVANVSLVKPKDLLFCASEIERVFAEGFAMGELMALLRPGETIGPAVIPPGHIGFATVCSITLNGVLLQYGIPTNSRFGGLLELQGKEAVRFVEIINYDGTSLDPLEAFIRSGMTDYKGAIATGDGKIGASFREFPADSREVVEELAGRLKRIGLGGFMALGWPGQALLDIPVNEGNFGAVLIGGLNPAAILEENGYRIVSRALAGLLDWERFFHYSEMTKRLQAGL